VVTHLQIPIEIRERAARQKGSLARTLRGTRNMLDAVQNLAVISTWLIVGGDWRGGDLTIRLLHTP